MRKADFAEGLWFLLAIRESRAILPGAARDCR
jgi:hypothetical protein